MMSWFGKNETGEEIISKIIHDTNQVSQTGGGSVGEKGPNNIPLRNAHDRVESYPNSTLLPHN